MGDTRSPVRNGAGSKNGGGGVKNKPKLGEIGKHKNGSAARGQTNGTNGSSEVDSKKGEKEKQTEDQDEEGWKAHLDGLMGTGKVGLKQPHQSLQLSCSTYRRKATLLNLMRWSLTFPEESFTL